MKEGFSFPGLIASFDSVQSSILNLGTLCGVKQSRPRNSAAKRQVLPFVNMATKFQPVCVADFEKYAHEILPRNALDYYRSGANNEETLQDNVKAFRRHDIHVYDV